ncbi:type I glyceraldehyde-3-phosphate dehydrogenase [Candidatus Giovannonibacteria bacterium RIFCSPLOWO2_02_FULL_45_14]|uniref:Type I glyceraldehyde-3-phosphate dehydrogenase n=1 Tax=Candidatus Giovannonibacteria bacterium RIFCSPLOWO2_12_FULL_44_15 TaxID=1798364 RepID=A0A1F5XZX5_9BACT|nr:MAG: type I glyceraldehyde-3-phosphate dehydrogenase [Candidatus Giovannonibacteria bacterium RIFCSPHIGHO2_02_FULL_44_31]OGF77111.1 MAG: type I glyceraldehyde-3-phosphate dehydrogenase [Candidatus Giovannonibacteria bacterium RIFCSPHIGHO2_12_FULL_44_29]OGF91352.1 MAG: type I glyceraldehyde-3-phosphate dehydrogenase [Candidatus Giovannonibacteria bacterium RIFCSPLOWO2_02_FULL_45_14]OGF93340.1 MAG: type I glyceraldehyde-3-phosphate dehydrogenase [Candidatus Giovannonibacteria bacterium RIFCSPLO
MAKIAINGFGRIGRSFFRVAFGDKDLEIVAINDLADPKTLKYLLKYDSVYGRYNKEIKGVKFLAEKDPSKLPWKKLGVDIVIESTGFFTDAVKARAHLDAGAGRVVITAPASGGANTALIGVNDDRFGDKNPITANASCTTNSVAPVMKILLKNFGIKKATMTTVHAYTATQKLVDGPDEKDQRRGRAAAANIIPSSTGAAEAVIQSIPELEGKFNAESIRVPAITGSLSIITAIVDKKASVESINKVFEKAEREEEWSKVLKTTYDPIVSTDIIGEPYGAIMDLSLTKVLDADFVKVFSWYDNEAGYTATLVEHVRRVAENI